MKEAYKAINLVFKQVLQKYYHVPSVLNQTF